MGRQFLWQLSAKESHLPMQETWVRSLIREDATCCIATMPAHRICAPEPGNSNDWAHELQPLKLEHPAAYTPQPEWPLQQEAREPQLQSSPTTHRQTEAWAAVKTQHSQNKSITS